ncbi:hypothetical protein PCASD_02455 [Puccinia coronata f. sp. avenae]|uniref:DDE Tnp4 domain-containing protein n=1 Tax=Puccinia coronata f. sp. avenae TaxID=200324 RepID=A0A2N5VMB1_9BASI|nr:hypothetical protein PCASD_02455 [Puccinia coronata f. sp. avenae]
MSDNDFCQSARTTKEGLIHVLSNIYEHPVFFSHGWKPQLPVPHQLALTLERLATYGNGASIGRLSWNLSVGRGTVVKVTRRVLTALLDLGKRYVTWPDKNRRKEISKVMQLEGFNGCVGFVEGTTFPLFQRPGMDGEVFFDRKKQYSINAQIAPAAYVHENTEFNYCLAKARVRNEHTIGILKNRWSSLHEIRLHLYERPHMKWHIKWIYCCIILHNMLAKLGDSWEEQVNEENPNPNNNKLPPDSTARFEDWCSEVKRDCLKVNYARNVLPIP